MPRQIKSCIYLLSAALTCTAGFSTQVAAQTVEPIDEIVALVDNDVILRSELELSIQGIVDRINAQGGNVPPRDVLESQVLERLITRRLQIHRGLQTGIRVSDADIDQAVINLAQQNNLTVDQMRRVIEQDGEDFGEFRLNIGEELIMERLNQRVVNSMPPISDTEVDILLASEDLSGGEYNISHIMVNLPEGASQQQIQAAGAKISDVHQRLQNGLDFASAAISYSESQEALEGGLVGWRDLNSIPRGFADAIKDLTPGNFSDPIRSPVGFHIMMVNDYRERGQVMIKEFNARHIMIENNELVTPRQAMDTIMDLKNRLDDGESFNDLAKEYSDDTTTANIGGEMGWFPPAAFGTRVEQTLLALQDDEISEPFQTQAGWHIIQRLGEREMDRTQDALRGDAREKIRQRKADEEINKFIRTVRDEAFVEIRLAES